MHYPGAVLDPDTGALISDAEVSEPPTPWPSEAVVASQPGWWCAGPRRQLPDGLFPVWRITRSSPTRPCPPPRPTSPTATRDRGDTFADLIDGPLAHIPSGLFAANCAWLACAVVTHNLLRAAGTLAGGDHAVARGPRCAAT